MTFLYSIISGIRFLRSLSKGSSTSHLFSVQRNCPRYFIIFIFPSFDSRRSVISLFSIIKMRSYP